MTTIRKVSSMPDYDVNDYMRQRPRPAWEEFGSEGDGEREHRQAKERSQGKTRKSSAQIHQEAADERLSEIAQYRQSVREQVLARNEAQRAERERYRGVSSADILAAPIVGPARRVGQLVPDDDETPLERFRRQRKVRDRARQRRLARGE
jgi:hypothetical protein